MKKKNLIDKIIINVIIYIKLEFSYFFSGFKINTITKMPLNIF